MSPAQQRGLALWASLLSALVCLLFLPVPRWGAWLILLVTLALIIGIWRIASRRTGRNVASTLDPLPEGAYRQPVVLVCGDLPCVWPPASPVRVVKQGCWIRVEKTEELQQVARQVLSQRPEWGPQLSVLLCVCPQRHAQSDALTSALRLPAAACAKRCADQRSAGPALATQPAASADGVCRTAGAAGAGGQRDESRPVVAGGDTG